MHTMTIEDMIEHIASCENCKESLYRMDREGWEYPQYLFFTDEGTPTTPCQQWRDKA